MILALVGVLSPMQEGQDRLIAYVICALTKPGTVLCYSNATFCAGCVSEIFPALFVWPLIPGTNRSSMLAVRFKQSQGQIAW